MIQYFLDSHIGYINIMQGGKIMILEKDIGLDRKRLNEIEEKETQIFFDKTKKSKEILKKARENMPNGVPMTWMKGLYKHEPIVVLKGKGAYFEDIDGNCYLDMNVVDLSMMLGFAPFEIVEAGYQQLKKGTNFLLPTIEAMEVSAILSERTSMPFWQYTVSASGANTEAIRLARAATGKDKIIIFSGKYHGHIEDTMGEVDDDGNIIQEALGMKKEAVSDTIVIPYNDIISVRNALGNGDVACILVEPALTNSTLVLPNNDFLKGLRELADETGAILVFDETHTFFLAYGGLTTKYDIQPDIMTLGKGFGTGVPIGAYGMKPFLAELMEKYLEEDFSEQRGVATGGTLFANAFSISVAKAALTSLLTKENYTKAEMLGEKLTRGIESLIAKYKLPWRAHHLGPRSGFCLFPSLPRDGKEAMESMDLDFINARRVFMANRGIWDAITTSGPHASFAHTAEDIDRYLEVLNEFFNEAVEC